MAASTVGVFLVVGIYTLYKVTFFFCFFYKNSLIDSFPASKTVCKAS